MMFLLGRQAMFGHDPPTYLRSIAATRCPCLAKVQAAIVDPVPPPRITRSYSSGSIFLDNWAEETFSILFYVSSRFLQRFRFLEKFKCLLPNPPNDRLLDVGILGDIRANK